MLILLPICKHGPLLSWSILSVLGTLKCQQEEGVCVQSQQCFFLDKISVQGDKVFLYHTGHDGLLFSNKDNKYTHM